ncbi:hypothetical protein SAMN05518671_4221 [Stenotrophomonas lactitubi]|uniref:hypothetical protein n=2 Tax=Stenotrophomonas TaxID=40323 RepID=UPI000B69E412|nr:hypothetical protein [Stenotrophomonas lactitubi]SMR83719.1 hypothetical protein SAMN04487863_3999 [Stenotrophomonas sp. yr243]SNT66636.1 hypothetical protein SAMN05518671_4221 [Stenotrophomonas lactitubi]
MKTYVALGALLTFSVLPVSVNAEPQQRTQLQTKVMACGATEFTAMTSNSSTLASRQCDGSYVYGIGVSVNEAVENLNGFMAVRQEGVDCSANASSIESGAYGIGVFAHFTCNGWPIAGVGNSPTSAARNSLAIAEEMAANGTHCSAPLQGSYYPETYGFRFRYDCGNTQTNSSWSISGIGSNIDDANSIAMRVMRYTASTKSSCAFDAAGINGTILSVTLQCPSATATGYGSSVTAAANDALAQIGV